MSAFVGKKLRRVLLAGVMMGFALLSALATSATAFTEPGITGSATDVANCPATVIVRSEESACVHAYTRSGSVQIGTSTAPITVPGDTFDLGTAQGTGAGAICGLIPIGANGCTLAPPHGVLNGPAQPVPGGLLGAVGNVPLTGVSAKLEWAIPIQPNAVFGTAGGCSSSAFVTFNECRFLSALSGTATTLSIKIHLISPFLGASCFIGSAASPIAIPLTTGVTSPPPPAKPIHGKPYESLHFGAVDQVSGATLVNNSFAVPVARGCGTSGGGLVDASINRKLGLPSPPGRNAIVINADIEVLAAQAALDDGWPYV